MPLLIGGAGSPPNTSSVARSAGLAFRRAAAAGALVLATFCLPRPAEAQVAVSEGNEAEIFLRPGQTPPRDEPGDYPRLAAQLLMALQDTVTFDIRSTAGEPVPKGWNDLEPIVQGAAVLAFDPWFSLQSKVTLQSYSTLTEDQAFQDLDLQLDNLFLAYQRDRYAAYGGKFDVGIGDAQRVVSGIYLGFSGDSYYPGALGAGGIVTLPSGALGTQSVTAIAFKLDNTPLSSTLFGTQEALSTEEGGAGNTTWPQSFGVSYEIVDSALLPGLSLGVDYVRLAPGQEGERPMQGIAGRLGYHAPLSEETALRLFAEAVHMVGFQGQDLKVTDLIGSAELTVGNWQVTATAAQRGIASLDGDLAAQGIASDRDWGLSGSLAYVTDFGIILQGGLVVQEEQTIRSKQALFRVIYQLDF